MMGSRLAFQAGCRTTAMGIMPHTSVEKAIELALGLDIPFWPQLPNVSFSEDMYAQTARNFPGITTDLVSKEIDFSAGRFGDELDDYARKINEPETFSLGQSHSVVYHRFLAQNLAGYPAIRGQVTGPVSFGFRVTDETSRPIIYDEEVRALLFDFIQRKVNAQYAQLEEKNPGAFVWLDEPGLGWVFSGLSGYNDFQARQDYQGLLAGLDGPKALHLCANVNLPYLLGLGIELLSFDAYRLEIMPKGYTDAITTFLKEGGVISWGIVPTDSDGLSKETPETLAKLLLNYWEVVSLHGSLALKEIAEQALLAPARCCLKNVDSTITGDKAAVTQAKESSLLTTEEQQVERAFTHLKALSKILRDKFDL